jgi:hypothetical protein
MRSSSCATIGAQRWRRRTVRLEFKFVEQLVPLLWTREHPDHLIADALGVEIELEEDTRSHTLVLACQAEQDVLSADVVVLVQARLVLGQDDDLSRALGEALEHRTKGKEPKEGLRDPAPLTRRGFP